MRVKRPGMREQVVYFSLTQPEIGATPDVPGGSTVYQASVGSQAAPPCYGGVCVNCQGQINASLRQSKAATPTSVTTPAPSSSQSGAAGPRTSGMGTQIPASFQTTSDTCPACSQKLTPQRSTTMKSGTLPTTPANAGGFR